MTERDAIAFLIERGFKVTKPRASRPSARSRRHRDCDEHVRVSGMNEPVCVLHGQDRTEVLAFADSIAAIARGARRGFAWAA